MGCGSSTANDVINSVDIPEKKPNHLYPQQNSQVTSNIPEQKVMAPPMQMQGKPPVQSNNFNNNNNNTIDQHEHPQQDCNQIMFSEEHLEQYVQLEKEIHVMERKKVLQQLHCHVDALQVIIAEITKLEEQKAKLEGEIKTNNLQGKPEAKDLIKEIDSIEKTDPKEKNKVEPHTKYDSLEQQKKSITKELEEKRMKHAQLESEVCTLNNSAAELLDKYLKQDELLVCIFGEGYATTEEAKLGNQLEQLGDKKERIENARRKWKEAQLLLEYACKQLAIALKLWQNLSHIPTINLEVKYSLPEDAQNNLKLSGQNFQNMAKFGEMPRCTPQELQALEAMASSSSPGTLDERHLMVLENYSDEHKKALVKLNCFNKILSTAIHRDLVDVCEEVRFTSQALRKERIRAVNDIYKQRCGKSFDQDIDEMEGSDLKAMLSGCKGDDACPIDSSKLPKIENSEKKIMPPPNGAKPATIKQVDGKLQLKDLKELGEKKEIHKFNEGLQANRARVEKHLGEQLNSRRDLRAQRSPVRNDKAS